MVAGGLQASGAGSLRGWWPLITSSGDESALDVPDRHRRADAPEIGLNSFRLIDIREDRNSGVPAAASIPKMHRAKLIVNPGGLKASA